MDSEIIRIKEILNDDLFSGSKDWATSDTVSRVEWLLSMYKSLKDENDFLYDILLQKS